MKVILYLYTSLIEFVSNSVQAFSLTRAEDHSILKQAPVKLIPTDLTRLIAQVAAGEWSILYSRFSGIKLETGDSIFNFVVKSGFDGKKYGTLFQTVKSGKPFLTKDGKETATRVIPRDHAYNDKFWTIVRTAASGKPIPSPAAPKPAKKAAPKAAAKKVKK